jgi:hypothetical protein
VWSATDAGRYVKLHITARSGHDGQLAHPSAVRCSPARQHTPARQSPSAGSCRRIGADREKLALFGLSSFLDNIPYRGVIRKQSQHRLVILVKGRSWLASYPKTTETLVRVG